MPSYPRLDLSNRLLRIEGSRRQSATKAEPFSNPRGEPLSALFGRSLLVASRTQDRRGDVYHLDFKDPQQPNAYGWAVTQLFVRPEGVFVDRGARCAPLEKPRPLGINEAKALLKNSNRRALPATMVAQLQAHSSRQPTNPETTRGVFATTRSNRDRAFAEFEASLAGGTLPDAATLMGEVDYLQSRCISGDAFASRYRKSPKCNEPELDQATVSIALAQARSAIDAWKQSSGDIGASNGLHSGLDQSLRTLRAGFAVARFRAKQLELRSDSGFFPREVLANASALRNGLSSLPPLAQHPAQKHDLYVSISGAHESNVAIEAAVARFESSPRGIGDYNAFTSKLDAAKSGVELETALSNFSVSQPRHGPVDPSRLVADMERLNRYDVWEAASTSVRSADAEPLEPALAQRLHAQLWSAIDTYRANRSRSPVGAQNDLRAEIGRAQYQAGDRGLLNTFHTVMKDAPLKDRVETLLRMNKTLLSDL